VLKLAGNQIGRENMSQTIASVKGTRDFYPEEMAVRTWLYQNIRNVVDSYGYQEWDGPFLEKIDLYAAKSGEELVKEQSFVFNDRNGDPLTLRPELTPSLARMVAQRQNTLVFPLRWWSFGPFWRYERPQKGRTREFFQWNCDIIGTNSPEAEAELIAICATLFKTVGLSSSQVKVLVNNRRLMDSQLEKLGVDAEGKKSVFRLIDRRDKMPPAEWKAYAVEQGITAAQLDGLSSLLEDQNLWKQSDELVKVFGVLEAIGLMDYVQYDPQIIRGLDYYTGTVFEAKDQGAGGRSLLGGGRYDNLVGDVGGSPLSGAGFAMGDVMMGVILEKYGLLPVYEQSPAKVLVTVFDETRIGSSFALANELRSQGVKVNCYPEAAKLPKQLKFADRVGLRYVVIAGPDEEAAGMVTLKDLAKREQWTLPRSEIVRKLKGLLAEEQTV
jgi:histidyl-tRNA synthetase